MARDSSGNYTLPEAAFVAGTTIVAADVNSDLSDLGSEITDSLSRSGKGGMTAPLRTANGSAAAPSFAFTNDTGVGIYRSASGEASIAAGGSAVAKWTSAGFFASLLQSLTTVTLRLLGRQATSGSAVGVALDTDTTYVSGDKLVSFRNNTAEKSYIDYKGDFSGASGNGAFAWAVYQCGAAGAVTLTASYNVSSASWSTTDLSITLTTAPATYGISAGATYANGIGPELVRPSQVGATANHKLTGTDFTGAGKNFANGARGVFWVFGV